MNANEITYRRCAEAAALQDLKVKTELMQDIYRQASIEIALQVTEMQIRQLILSLFWSRA